MITCVSSQYHDIDLNQFHSHQPQVLSAFLHVVWVKTIQEYENSTGKWSEYNEKKYFHMTYARFRRDEFPSHQMQLKQWIMT